MSNRLRHFRLDEKQVFSPDSPQSGSLIDPVTFTRLDILRELWGRPLKINSGYRTIAHNRKVGGEPNSAHLRGRAFDIKVKPEDIMALKALAEKCGFTGFGLYDTWLHVDDMTAAEGYPRPTVWDKRTKKG